MSTAEQLWNENHELALASLHNPFVQGILDGSLPKETFSYYVSQDSFFLKTFARAYIIAGAKAPDWADFIKLHKLAEGVLFELQLHGKYAREWGVNLDQVEPAAATRHYTDFVMATAWGHDTGLTVTALTPCMRLYAWLGQTLAAQEPPEHAYSEWIRTYSGQEIEDLARDLEELVDKCTTPGDPLVAATYRYAMECERDFFQAAFDSVK
jgi:thiaminase/transcriptional activator TenA